MFDPVRPFLELPTSAQVNMQQEPIRIRAASADELDSVAQLQVTIFGEVTVTPRMAEEFLFGHGQVVFVEHNTGKIGFSIAYPEFYRIADKTVPCLFIAMIGVLAEYRDAGLGMRLKMFLREDALARGFQIIRWTYNPMRSRNAHLNINKLGGYVDELQPAQVGNRDGFPRERFVLTWNLCAPASRHEPDTVDSNEVALAVDEDRDVVEVKRAILGCKSQVLSLPIPADFEVLKIEKPDLLRAWHKALAESARELFAMGYRIDRYARTYERFGGYYQFVRHLH